MPGYTCYMLLANIVTFLSASYHQLLQQTSSHHFRSFMRCDLLISGQEKNTHKIFAQRIFHMRQALKINHGAFFFVISHCRTNLIYFTSFVGIDIILYAIYIYIDVVSEICKRAASVSPTVYILNFASKYFI